MQHLLNLETEVISTLTLLIKVSHMYQDSNVCKLQSKARLSSCPKGLRTVKLELLPLIMKSH